MRSKSLLAAAAGFAAMASSGHAAAQSIEGFGRIYSTSSTGTRGLTVLPRQHSFNGYHGISAADLRWLRGVMLTVKPAGSKLQRKAREGRLGLGHPR